MDLIQLNMNEMNGTWSLVLDPWSMVLGWGEWLDQISSTTDVNVTSFLFNLRKKKNSSQDLSGGCISQYWDTSLLPHS